MLKMVDGTGIIGVDMICPLGVSTPQPPNYDRVEMEGTGILVLPNSLNAPLERLELGGKTEQVQTSGKQLFDASRYEGVTKNGVTVTVKDGVITATGTPNINTWIQVFVSRENYQKLFKPENKIYLKTNRSKDCNYDFGIYGSFGSPIIGTIREGNSGRVLPAELPRNDTDFYFFIDAKIGTELKGSIKPIVYHDGDGTWEPYTGGKPSPSPEYPQEIKNVGKWNEETQKYEVDAKVTGKNLLNLQKASEKVNWTQHSNFPGYYNFPVFVGRGNTVTISIPQKIPTGQGLFLSVCLTESGAREGRIAHNSNDSLNNTKLTYKATNDYIYLNAHSDTIAGMKKYFGNLQVEYGNVATPYQPYKEQTLTITSDRPITKWDRLVEQGGEYGWLYGSVIATIDETADISLYAPNGFCIHVKNIDKKEKSGYCDKLYTKKMSNGEPFVLFGIANNNFLYTFNTQEFYGKTASEIKAKLKEYPLNIIGKSETTEFIPLPQSEQNAIRALKTYYPATVITADGGELDPDIKVTYRKEI